MLLGSVADGELRRRRRGRRAEIRREIADSEIRLVTDCRDNRDIARRNSASHFFFVKSPKLFDRAAAAPDYEHISITPRVEPPYGIGYLTRRRRALNLHGAEDYLR